MKECIDRQVARIFLFLVKYLPIITTLLLIVHCVITIHHGEDPILDNLVRISPLRGLLIMTASFALRFCWIHRSFTVYNLIVSTLMVVHEELTIPNTMLFYIRVASILSGIGLFIILFIYRKMFKRNLDKIKL